MHKSIITRSPATAKAARIGLRTALSGIDVQHAGYSRRGNFGGSLVQSMF